MAAYRASPHAASLTARAEGPQGMLTTVLLDIPCDHATIKHEAYRMLLT